MSTQQNNNDFMEDISSNSKRFKLDVDPVDLYGNLIYKNIDKIIKAISYIVAIITIIIGIGFALLIAKKQILYIALSFGVVLVSTVFAAIEFFIIYGLGYLIKQNKEILKRL